MLLSDDIGGELRRVLLRLAHRHGLSASEIDGLADAPSIQAEVIESATASTPGPRYTKDQDVLGTPVAVLQTGHADCLITGDKHLLALADRHPILSPAEFRAKHAVHWEEGPCSQSLRQALDLCLGSRMP